MRIENILKSVKKRIRPGKAPLSIKKKLDMINQLLKKNKIKAKAVLGGSFAKNTHLKDDYDIDIFVKFDYSYEKKEISNILDKVLSPLKAERVHGSRDYFQIKNKLSYEIIPVLDVKDVSKARNITDMSPMHVDWVRKNINGKEDEIRLAKLFCKANDIYGAESYIQGISGHVLDILVIYYGNFIKFLEAVTGWKDGKKEKEVIDFYNFYKGEAIRKMNRSKTLSPLIVVDPISPDRNAAAALSKEKYDLLRKTAREFLSNPSLKFFKKEKITLPKLMKMKGKDKLLIFDIKALEGKQDVIGSKLLKAYKYILNKFINNSFTIIDSGWEWDKKKKAFFWFIAKKEMLEKEFLRVGPPLEQRYHVELFRNKHKQSIEKDGRIYANVKRSYRKIEKLAKDLLKNQNIKDKVESIKLNFIR